MIPVDLDPEVVRIGVVARGKALGARLRFLRRGGAKRIRIFSDDPGEKLGERLEKVILNRLPSGEDLKGLDVLFVAGLEPEETENLVKLAQRRRILVNSDLSKRQNNFTVPAVLRRGDLTLTVSTGGDLPGLGKRLRKYLNEVFGKEWDGRIKELTRARDVWQANGAKQQELNRMINAMIDEKNWLP